VDFYSSTLQAYALYHPILAFALLAAWPVRTWGRRALLLALGVPSVLLSTSLDIPFVLTGHFQEIFVATPPTGPLPWDARMLDSSCLHNGGRFGLTLAVALAFALLATRDRARPPSGDAGVR